MRPSSAHIAFSRPYAEHHELTRSLLDTTPAATILRHETAATGASTTSMTVKRSADDQLHAMRIDARVELRGIPLIGAGPGAIAHTRPESCLDKLTRLQLLWQLGASLAAQAATAPCHPPTYQ